MPGGQGSGGFTLIELVVVIVLTGILAVLVGRSISRPIEGFVALSRRAELVDVAQTALDRMTREIRLALPNSVRISGTALEFLRTLDGGRYRAQADPGNPASDPLNFTTQSGSFDVLGPLGNASSIVAGAGGKPACLAGTIDCLVIYNTGQPGADAYDGDDLAGISSASATKISFAGQGASGTPFPLRSPRQRFQIVDTPVSFVCAPDPLNGGTITRYAHYPITAAQAVPPSGGTSALLANDVSACSFSYDPGTATRAGLVTMSVQISKDGETISLLQQVHVSNLP